MLRPEYVACDRIDVIVTASLSINARPIIKST